MPSHLALWAALALAACSAPAASPEVDAAGSTQAAVRNWTCPMHPEVRQTEPGVCPSCGMQLVEQGGAESAEPADHHTPIVAISTERQQLIGVRLSAVTEGPVVKELVAAGTLASDESRLVEVPSPVSGVVDQVYGNSIGQEVRRGEPLLSVVTDDGAKVTIRATATGHISWRVQTVGAKIPPNGYNVCTIYDHAGIWVWVEIFESDITWVKVGQLATMTVPAFPGRTFQGKVTQVSPLLNSDTHTMRVRVDFPNTDFSLKPGMSAVLAIQAEAGEKLTVPESAVIRTGAENVVFVARGEGRFEVRNIRLGLLFGDAYEVLDGLAAGDQIVTSANFLVDSESKLQGVRAAWDPPR